MDSENTGIPATMLVGPTSAGGYPVYMGNGNNGNNGFGGDWAWIILLLVLCGGWGNNGMGGGFGGGNLYPWLNQSNQISDGFRDQMTHNAVTSIGDKLVSGFGDLQTALCGGFAGVNATVNNAQNAISQQLYATQINDQQNIFSLQSALQNCCCENRAGIADLRYTVATEACADRAAVNDALRDVLAANTASTQRILDQLCQDKIDAKNEKIADLERQLTMANLSASQIAQTAQFQRSQDAQTDAIYARFRDCPVPTQPVYGMTPIFTCPTNNNNCGCGCGNNF